MAANPQEQPGNVAPIPLDPGQTEAGLKLLQEMQVTTPNNPNQGKVKPEQTIVKMDNSKEAKAMVDCIEELIKPSLQIREGRKKTWIRSLAQMRGNFTLTWQKKAQKLGRIKQPRNAVPVNFAVAMLLDQAARCLPQMGTEFNVSPSSSTETDCQTADVSEGLLFNYVTPELDTILAEWFFYVSTLDRTCIRPQCYEVGVKFMPRMGDMPSAIPVPDPTQPTQQYLVGGKPQFFEMDAGNVVKKRIKSYELRIECIPPHLTGWDPRRTTPGQMRDMRFIFHDGALTRAELYDLVGDADTKEKILSWDKRVEQGDIEHEFAKLATGDEESIEPYGAATDGGEESVNIREVTIAPRNWCDDRISKKFPSEGLRHGLVVTYDSVNRAIVHAATMQAHTQDLWGQERIENAFACAQQLPIFTGTYNPTIHETTAPLQRDISKFNSDMSAFREKLGDIRILVPDINEPKVHRVGNDITFIGYQPGGGQAINIGQLDVPGTWISLSQLGPQMLQQIAGLTTLVVAPHAQTATEIRNKDMTSGSRYDLTTRALSLAMEHVARESLAMIRCYWNTEQLIRVRGRFDVMADYSLRRADLYGRADIHVSAGRYAFGSVETHWAMVEKLFAMGAITDRDELRRMMRMRETFEDTAADLARKRCNSTLQKICTSGMLYKSEPFNGFVYPMDDLMAFVAEIKRYWSRYGEDIEEQTRMEMSVLSNAMEKVMADPSNPSPDAAKAVVQSELQKTTLNRILAFFGQVSSQIQAQQQSMALAADPATKAAIMNQGKQDDLNAQRIDIEKQRAEAEVQRVAQEGQRDQNANQIDQAKLNQDAELTREKITAQIEIAGMRGSGQQSRKAP